MTISSWLWAGRVFLACRKKQLTQSVVQSYSDRTVNQKYLKFLKFSNQKQVKGFTPQMDYRKLKTNEKSQISEDELKVKVLEFQRWIKTQPQLPQNIGKLL